MIVSNIGPFYPKMVKEFIVNLPKGFNDARSSKFTKVHVRGHCFELFLAMINDHLVRGKLIIANHIPSFKIRM